MFREKTVHGIFFSNQRTQSVPDLENDSNEMSKYFPNLSPLSIAVLQNLNLQLKIPASFIEKGCLRFHLSKHFTVKPVKLCTFKVPLAYLKATFYMHSQDETHP